MLRRLTLAGALLAALIFPVGCDRVDRVLAQVDSQTPMTCVFIGLDISGSFLRGKYFDDSLEFLANYIHGHLKGSDGLDVPHALFVGTIGGTKPGEPKTFYPIQTFENSTVAEIHKKLQELFPKARENPITDFNAFFDQIATLVQNKKLILKPISIVLVSDGKPDIPGKKGDEKFRSIDIKPLEKLSRNVTVRLIYTDAVTGQNWVTKIPRRRIKFWTQDAAVMVGWKDPKIMLPGKAIEDQTRFYDWVKDNVDFPAPVDPGGLMAKEYSKLDKTLGPVALWALGVGYVISGMYFGWNLGLPLGGTYGFLVATLLVTVLYVAFVLGYAELSCAFPRAGGAFVFANQALGPELGYLTGVAQWIEFIFAPPAIAAAIGGYFGLYLDAVHPTAIAVAAYAIFTALNIWGVRQSAVFEVVVTMLAVLELLLFSCVAGSHFSWVQFSKNALPNGWSGVFGAFPYAIWFYLGIEGLANTAEESKHPSRDLPRGYLWAIGTLVVLALLVLFAAVGVAGWEAVVYRPGTMETSDSPLPLALSRAVGIGVFYGLLVGVGLCGLLASFHGIILIAGRAVMEMGRTGYAPAFLGETLKKQKTPAGALLLNMIIGIGALFTERTSDIITMSVFGALTLYILSMLSLIALRRNQPRLARPFKVPCYPWTPGLALVLSLICLVAMAYYNWRIWLYYLALLAAGFVWYSWVIPKSVRSAPFRVKA